MSILRLYWRRPQRPKPGMPSGSGQLAAEVHKTFSCLHSEEGRLVRRSKNWGHMAIQDRYAGLLCSLIRGTIGSGFDQSSSQTQKVAALHPGCFAAENRPTHRNAYPFTTDPNARSP